MLNQIDLEPTTRRGDKRDAAEVAERPLRDVGTRLAHSASVAYQVDRVRHLLDGVWEAVISDAAWLHDVGYNPAIARTGFHPLDGTQ